MQDFKHLTRKKRLSGFSFFKPAQANRRSQPQETHSALRLSLPSAQRREQLKLLLLFIAIVLGLTPVFLLAFQKAPAVVAWLRAPRPQPAKAAEAVKQPPLNRFEEASMLLTDATGEEQLTSRTSTGETLHYSIQGGLQRRIHGFFTANLVPYGVFVAIEPATGRILAMTSSSAAERSWTPNASFNLYPMASLFKIITASAALEARKITPDTVIEFRGRAYSENPRYWDINPKGKNSRIDLTYAMGKSINPVYGRVASDIAGKSSMMESVRRFGFNQEILKGTPARSSVAGEPQTSGQLKLMGAGLDHDVKISPLHAAVMMAAIANGGKMMAPSLTDKVTDEKGNVTSQAEPREIRRLVAPETAAALTRMLSTTVTSGTSRRAFHDRKGRPMLANVEIAAKTGSINGVDPKGHYSWFAAYAPARAPRIALVALVINQDKWKIKASQVGEQALEEFFGK